MLQAKLTLHRQRKGVLSILCDDNAKNHFAFIAHVGRLSRPCLRKYDSPSEVQLLKIHSESQFSFCYHQQLAVWEA